MAIEITSLDQLPPELVQELQAEFVQLVAERHPEVDLSLGVFHDLIAHFSGGISGAINQYKIKQYLNARSLQALNENPETADAELVDAVLSNYRVTRKSGAEATGEITLIMTADASVVLAAGAVFESSGVSYVLPGAYVARPTTSTTPLGLNERRLVALADGTFAFSVPAAAAVTGIAGNIPSGSMMTPQEPPPNFLRAFAATDFTGGTDTETNEQLLERLETGVAARCMQGRSNIIALLQSQPEFENVLHYQIVGYGNAELQRSQHSILPIALPGYIDIYPRTSAIPQRITVPKTAVFVGTDAGRSVWQLAIGRDDAPGFYVVDTIINAGDSAADSSGYEVSSVVRGLDTSNTDENFVPDVLTPLEAGFTRFQTAVVRFLDTTTPLSGLTANSSTKKVDVLLYVMPLLQDMQAFCSSRDVRNLTGDVLVRAPIPCFLTVTCEIQQGAGAPTLDLAVIRTAVADAVNYMVFPGQLHASTVAATIHQYLTSRQALGPIELFGRIVFPDGTQTFVRDSSVLTLPDRYDVMATGNTIAFFLDPDDVVLTVVNKGFELSQ